MGTSFPTGKKILLGREIAYMISQAGGSQAQAAALIETSPARMAGWWWTTGAARRQPRSVPRRG